MFNLSQVVYNVDMHYKGERKMFAKRFKQLRNEHGYTQKHIAKIMGLGQGIVSDWENGRKKPGRENMEFLADLFNVDYDYISGRSDVVRQYDYSIFREDKTKVIPLIGRIAAGKPILAEEDVEEYFRIDPRMKADFIIKVKGDSMVGACIFDGDFAFVRQQETLENSEIGAILIDGEATLKRFYKDDGIVTLVSENPKFKPMVFTNGDMRILGKLVGTLKIWE